MGAAIEIVSFAAISFYSTIFISKVDTWAKQNVYHMRLMKIREKLWSQLRFFLE